MTDADLVAKKAAAIETYLSELRTLVRPEELATDLRARRFTEHTLQIAIQAAQDIASHVVSSERLGEPRDNGHLFEILATRGWLPADLAARMRAMIGFRNVVVHGYDTVDLAVVRDVLANHLVDLERFVAAVRGHLRARAQGR